MIIKLDYIYKLAENLKSNTKGYLSVKILMNILKNSFKNKTGHPEIENISDMIEHLESKYNLL